MATNRGRGGRRGSRVRSWETLDDEALPGVRFCDLGIACRPEWRLFES